MRFTPTTALVNRSAVGHLDTVPRTLASLHSESKSPRFVMVRKSHSGAIGSIRTGSGRAAIHRRKAAFSRLRIRHPPYAGIFDRHADVKH